MMIVGTIRREDNYSWQDASKSWLEQDQEEENRTYYVGICQGAGSVPGGAKGGQSDRAALPPKKGSNSEEAAEECWWAPGPEDLVIEGEEGEYFLELLMREETLEKPVPTDSIATQPAKKKGGPER
jgi:hypothetical protein